jgi:hypothetical protein
VALKDATSEYKDKYHFIKLNNIKVPPEKDHKIDIHYWINPEEKKTISLHPPECSPFQKNLIHNLKPFEHNDYHIHLIQLLASRVELNPTFFAGLIAQESGFNPKAVSWSKAMGLTQMTPIAEKQVLMEFPNFTSYPDITLLSPLKIKTLVDREIINSNNDWRLDPYKSIQGGIIFMKYLQRYWEKPENLALIKKIEGPKSDVLSQILLASYNSGASRVKRAVTTDPINWIESGQLKEAKKYVRRVSSYCFHFSSSDENSEGP